MQRTVFAFFSNPTLWVQNLDFFHTREVMEAHLVENPCLTEDWAGLWERLQEQGWRRLEDPHTQKTVCYYYDVRFSYVRGVSAAKAAATATSIHGLREKGLLPGQQLFVSKLATIQYLARFPYLLQEDSVFLETLARLGWEVDTDAQKVGWEYTVTDMNGDSRWAIRPIGQKSVEEDW